MKVEKTRYRVYEGYPQGHLLYGSFMLTAIAVPYNMPDMRFKIKTVRSIVPNKTSTIEYIFPIVLKITAPELTLVLTSLFPIS